MSKWSKAQIWEKNWHGNCINSYWEETKQQVYARKMGLQAQMVDGKFPVYNLQGKSVLDIGGGPYSFLLKCVNFRRAIVIDPCEYPNWVADRYTLAGIVYHKVRGEDLVGLAEHEISDEVWIYNVLQHTDNPQKIIKNARRAGKLIRIFEWIETGVNEGHIHNLTEKDLNKWLHGEGKVEQLNESGCVGKAYYGIFPT